jgi:hypothetical protein
VNKLSNLYRHNLNQLRMQLEYGITLVQVDVQEELELLELVLIAVAN